MSWPKTADTGVAPASAVPIRVRQATTRDLEHVIALRVALLREHPNHPVYGRLRQDATERARDLYTVQLRSTLEAIFLAEMNNEVVGILRCVDSAGSPLLEPARYAYISSVFVKPAARRRGVLRALLRAAEQWSTERDLDQLRLHHVSGSPQAEGAWSALGFDVVEHVRVRSVKPEGR